MTEPAQKKPASKKTLAGVVGATAASILIGYGSNIGFTERFEGMVYTGYFDPIGIPTKCAGDTYDVEIGKRYTKAQCQESLEQGLIKHAEPVLRCTVGLEKHPFILAASVDHAYHFGPVAFCGSTIAKDINRGDYKSACRGFNQSATGAPQWQFVKDKLDKTTGKWTYKPLPGLVKRAAARRELCERDYTS